MQADTFAKKQHCYFNPYSSHLSHNILQKTCTTHLTVQAWNYHSPAFGVWELYWPFSERICYHKVLLSPKLYFLASISQKNVYLGEFITAHDNSGTAKCLETRRWMTKERKGKSASKAYLILLKFLQTLQWFVRNVVRLSQNSVAMKRSHCAHSYAELCWWDQTSVPTLHALLSDSIRCSLPIFRPLKSYNTLYTPVCLSHHTWISQSTGSV